jgi:hypothetical protein
MKEPRESGWLGLRQKTYLKNVRFRIELLWSVLGGLGLTVLVKLVASGSPNRLFNLERNIFNLDMWIYTGDREWNFRHNADNFLFGFIVTAIIIWSVKVYRKN